jgi:branched-chain amino acid transport system permease protein
MLIQSLVNGVMGALILILIASGLCLIFGIMHIVNFAHGEFFMLGGFGAWLFFVKYPLPFIEAETLRYILAVILAMVFVGILGVIAEKYIFRPFRGNLQATIIVATGLMLILQAGSLVSFGVTDKAISSPFSGMFSFGSISLSSERMAAIICGVVFIIAMYFFILRTKLGKAMRAVAQDQEAAQVQGINIGLIFSLSMAIGCALAAAGGALVGPIFYVNPYMGVEPIMKAFVVIILGGMGSLPGAIICGFIIGMTESFVTTYVGAHFAMVVVFLLLIGVLLVRPTGIFGHEE